MNGVAKTPTSMPNAPMNMKCDERRFSSQRIMRIHCARSGTSISARASTAIT